MKRDFLVLAVLVTVFTLFLSTRSQTFTRVIVDGRAMRMLIEGSGAATVVFENGGGPPLEMWGKVQPRVSRFAKTVTYDRAGVGFSDPGPRPRDGRRIAVELHEALRAADVAPPYFLVGASSGGLYVRVFAGTYPDEVSGMLLVDPTHDGDNIGNSEDPELAVIKHTVEQARASAVPPGIPVVLIDALGPSDVPFATAAVRQLREKYRPAVAADSRTYQAWLDTIPGARMIVTERSGHNVSHEQPELVVETIREAVSALRVR